MWTFSCRLEMGRCDSCCQRCKTYRLCVLLEIHLVALTTDYAYMRGYSPLHSRAENTLHHYITYPPLTLRTLDEPPYPDKKVADSMQPSPRRRQNVALVLPREIYDIRPRICPSDLGAAHFNIPLAPRSPPSGDELCFQVPIDCVVEARLREPHPHMH